MGYGTFFLKKTKISDMQNCAGPGSLWPFPCDVSLAYVNEPVAGGRGCNLSYADNADDPWDVRFVAVCDISAGDELFIDYGRLYDRSSYLLSDRQK
jgi:hypothetical protein